MKLLVILAFYLSGCLGKLNQQQLGTVTGLTKECFKELNIPSDSNLLERALKHKFTTFTDQEIDYFACMGRRIGVLDEDGIFHSQPIKDFFLKADGSDFNKQDVTDVVETCIGQQVEGTPYKENVAKFNKCFYENKKFDLM